MNTKKIIKEVAKQFGVSEKEVLQEMQAAINIAYENPSDDFVAVRQKRVPCNGSVPTPVEFIKYAAEKITDLQ